MIGARNAQNKGGRRAPRADFELPPSPPARHPRRRAARLPYPSGALLDVPVPPRTAALRSETRGASKSASRLAKLGAMPAAGLAGALLARSGSRHSAWRLLAS